MKFCSDCGSIDLRSVAGGQGQVQRFDCGRCGATHWRQPRVVAVCLAEWHGQVLLCRRAIEPGAGQWTLPGGYVEAGEPLQAAAARETLEEAQAIADDLALYRVYNLPKFNEVVAVFRGTLREGRYSAGDETQEAALWNKRDLPWDQLAFEYVRAALQDFALQRWQPVYASPVQDLVWMPPCTPVKPAARSAARAVQPVQRGLRAAPRAAVPLAAARSAAT
jgi:ADP-ribose pyrophosphatase YjhB (NUDIX family)